MFQRLQQRWYRFADTFTDHERLLFLSGSFVLGLAMVVALAGTPLPAFGPGVLVVGSPLTGTQRLVVGLPVGVHDVEDGLVLLDLSAVESHDDVAVRSHVGRPRPGAGDGIGTARLATALDHYDLRDLHGHVVAEGDQPWEPVVEVGFAHGDAAVWRVVGPFDLRYRTGIRHHVHRWCTFVVIWSGTEPDEVAVDTEVATRRDRHC